MRRLLIAAVLVLGSLGVAEAVNPTGNEEAACSDSAVFFCENFEDRAVGTGDTTTLMNQARYKNPGWSYCFGCTGVPGTTTMTIVSSPTAFGSKALQFDYGVGDNPTGAGFMDFDFSSLGGARTNLYVRFYIRYPTGFPLGCQNGSSATTPGFCNNKLMELLATSGSTLVDEFPWEFQCNGCGGQVPATMPNVNGVPNPGGANPGLAQNENGIAFATRDVFQCIEAHYLLNSSGGASDGLIESWIDGVRHWNYPGIKLFTGTSNGIFRMRLTGSGSSNNYPSNGHVRQIDNIIMSTARIGCIGSTSNPPAAPTNLKGCIGPPCTPIATSPSFRWLARIWSWLVPAWA